MIGVVVAIVNGYMEAELLEETFMMERWLLPKFPGEGLMLDKVEYPEHIRFSKKNGKADRDVEFRSIRPLIEKWKRETLFRHIIAHVMKERTFENWMEGLKTSPPGREDKGIDTS
jgi:hypothetical protein